MTREIEDQEGVDARSEPATESQQKTRTPGQQFRERWDPFASDADADLDKEKSLLLARIFKDVFSREANDLPEQQNEDGRSTSSESWWARWRRKYIASKIRERINTSFEQPESSTIAWFISGVIVLSILVSAVTFCMESMPEFEDSLALEIIGYVCLAIFTIDYVTRMLTTPDFKKFFLSVLNFIDLCAILPFWIALMVQGPSASAADQTRILRVLRLVRVVRLLRIFPLFFNMSLVIDALVLSYGAILMLIFMLIIMLVVFASTVYYIESSTDGSVFYSIPQSMYFIQTTLTTTGYGDLVPITVGGKIVVGLMMICAVIILALPITIIGSNFSTIWANSKTRRRTAEKSPLIWSNFKTLVELMQRQRAAVEDIMGLFDELQDAIEQNVDYIRDLAHKARLVYLSRATKGKTEGWEQDMATLKNLLVQMGDRIAYSRDRYVELESLVQLSSVTRCDNYTIKLNRMLEAYKHLNSLFQDAGNAVSQVRSLTNRLAADPAVDQQ